MRQISQIRKDLLVSHLRHQMKILRNLLLDIEENEFHFQNDSLIFEKMETNMRQIKNTWLEN